MKLFHLFALSALVLSFSGKPALKSDRSVVAFDTDSSLVKEATMIPWETDKRLVWDDFLCEPRTGTDAVASTSTSLGIAYQLNDGQLTYHITCYFNKEKSWGLMKTDYILAHEQGHFDITEIFARRLNEALQNYRFNKRTFKRDIGEIYQSIVSQKEEYQKAYDSETDHSRNKKLQFDWLEHIDKLLAEQVLFLSIHKPTLNSKALNITHIGLFTIAKSVSYLLVASLEGEIGRSGL